MFSAKVTLAVLLVAVAVCVSALPKSQYAFLNEFEGENSAVYLNFIPHFFLFFFSVKQKRGYKCIIIIVLLY